MYLLSVYVQKIYRVGDTQCESDSRPPGAGGARGRVQVQADRLRGGVHGVDAGVGGRRRGLDGSLALQDPAAAVEDHQVLGGDLGFSRIVASEIEVPNMLVDMV